MMTGQEQYYLERAGYFIRRHAVKKEHAANSMQAQIGPLEDLAASLQEDRVRLWDAVRTLFGLFDAADLRDILYSALGDALCLHQASHLCLADEADSRTWHRDFGPALDASDGAQRTCLARFQQSLCIHVAFLLDESLLVVPATHSEPLAPRDQQAVLADARASLAGEIRIRLLPGDALFYNANLLHRRDCAVEPTRGAAVITIVSRSLAEQIGSARPALPFLPSALPAEAHSLFALFDRVLPAPASDLSGNDS